MHKDDIIRFLEAIDADLVPHAGRGERLECYILGRSALILNCGVNLGTKDVDLVNHGDETVLLIKAFELFGKGTPHALEWGLYLEKVPAGLPPVPGHYRKMAEELPGTWKILNPKLLEPHDLAVTKLKRFHAKDREDLRILCDSGKLTKADLEEAFVSAFQFGIDEEEDSSYQGVQKHFRHLIDYLEGRTDNL